MSYFYGGYDHLALEVIAGTDLPVPSPRTPIGYYVRASTSCGRWNTTIKAAKADYSVSWTETLNIHGAPLTFLQWCIPKNFRTSEPVHLEIRALYESGHELVCAFETTFKHLLGRDGQSITLPAIDDQGIILTLNINTTPHALSSSPEHTRPRERNVVIFGETGSGKSSFVNRIAQHLLAETSIDARGCTSAPERYPVEISDKEYVLIDTPGLNEVSVGTVPDAKAKKLLESLLRELMSSRSDDIGLLVYCVRRAVKPHIFAKAYNKFHSEICHNRVPIILVVEGWKNERDMERWWNTNGKECRNHHMHFENDPYRTAHQEIDFQPIPDDVTLSDAESNDFLRNLIATHYSA
ncbi:P-loop containing nucleoside triphosphate hydrolase protein [Suillus occidentalis]|nr:P-loop containing nucleoside triphosphate hydrolase protein [Suillus occidentalis]